MSTRNLPGGKGWPVHKVNLTTIYETTVLLSANSQEEELPTHRHTYKGILKKTELADRSTAVSSAVLQTPEDD
jgi:hypothetical protein